MFVNILVPIFITLVLLVVNPAHLQRNVLFIGKLNSVFLAVHAVSILALFWSLSLHDRGFYVSRYYFRLREKAGLV